MQVYNLIYQPTMLDVLKDSHTGEYVQFAGGVMGQTTNRNQEIICKRLTDGQRVGYQICGADIIELAVKEKASEILSQELQKHVHRINEGVRITGKIVARRA